MEKIVSAFDARRQFGALLTGVDVRGERIIITRHGEPVAAVVPLTVYEQIQREHGGSPATGDELTSRTATQIELTEEEAMELALEAVAWARAERKREQRQ